MTLSEEQIRSRITAYGCCSLSQLHKWVQGKIHGDTKCAKESMAMSMYLLWAQGIMCDPCYDATYKTEVAARADCYCKPCGCPPVTREQDCVIPPDFLADFVVEEMPEDPAVGVYLVLSTGEIITIESPDS